ncbi:hypothetical protein HCN44_007463 [Aphidius gifuensis]|uniref:Uncharacterized protein n=1 Tax=Aphidius gifuensis TaxID=684658 RepID=A0A834XMP8_APHGI|nr:uncharacterized protein LOC122857348 [Aphidius gifuensis]KAF7989153.1 hypothetical protein HCN44_007463 [Aphidius gifuensis]
MVLINMRIFKTILITLSLLSMMIGGFNCSPLSSSLRAEHRGTDDDGLDLSSDNLTSELSSKDDYFDQRQNGTENYRIHVDGLVLVVAPIEALLLAASNTELSDNYFPINKNKTEIIKPDNETIKPEQSKPDNETTKPDNETIKPEPNDDKITEKTDLNNKINHKHHLRFASLLGPVLKKLINQSA